jgi:spore maturation protein CgeB
MMKKMNFVFLGLSLTSSWGNGHATTYRALLRGLHALGHHCTFLERRKPWFVENVDLPQADFCTILSYDDVWELSERHAGLIGDADAVIIGSYVPEGPRVIDAVAMLAPKRLCFYDIDTPVTLGKIARGDTEYIEPRQFALFDIYFSFSGGENLLRLETLGARRAEPLYCSVDPDRYRNTGEPIEWDLGYLGTYSDDRQPALERLLLEPARRRPDLRFVVAGAQYPDGIDWPTNVERIAHIPPDEHASFYSRQRFTLNVTRKDMVTAGWSPSVRLFEASACRVPIISDHWRGLYELLPEGEAVFTAHSSEDVTTILVQTGDEERRRVAENAHEIVCQHHTGTARAKDLVQALSEPVNEKGIDSNGRFPPYSADGTPRSHLRRA